MFNDFKSELTLAMVELNEAFETVNQVPRRYQLKKEYRTVRSKSFSYNETVYTMLCNLCGQEFQTNRGHALWCSNACRTRAHREKRQAQHFIDANLFIIGLLFIIMLIFCTPLKTLQKRSH